MRDDEFDAADEQGKEAQRGDPVRHPDDGRMPGSRGGLRHSGREFGDERVRQALHGLKNDPNADEIRKNAKTPGFESATDRDYENVRAVYRLIAQ